MLSDADQQKIKDLRLTAFAQKFFELTGEQANERLTPEEVNRTGFNRGKEIGIGTLLSCRLNTLMN